ncbi:MAG TPA: DUF1634 domain-containing protein [Thermoanaerobaculia bacterium]|nr:DUF1634 domain-containing protein [Thermoanaerobaculia bacterium]
MESSTDSQLARNASVVLFGGVALSCILLIAGLARYAMHPDPIGSLQPMQMRRLGDGLAAGNPVALIHLGLLVLMITPIARIVILLIEFIRERRFAFAAISFGVLLLISLGIVLGLGS